MSAGSSGRHRGRSDLACDIALQILCPYVWKHNYIMIICVITELLWSNQALSLLVSYSIVHDNKAT